MEPYYSTPDGTIRIFHARWEDVFTAGIFTRKTIAFVHADGPYGVKEATNRKEKGRGKLTEGHNWKPVAGDDKPFDPQPLLDLDLPTVTWGANHYASRIEWDKRDEVSSDDNADFELAWTNLGGPCRKFRHLWRGLCRASETGIAWHVLHPTQKPEALSAWVFNHAMQRKPWGLKSLRARSTSRIAQRASTLACVPWRVKKTPRQPVPCSRDCKLPTFLPRQTPVVKRANLLIRSETGFVRGRVVFLGSATGPGSVELRSRRRDGAARRSRTNMSNKKVTLSNSFHGTKITVLARTAALFSMDAPSYPNASQKRAAKRVRNRLCGSNECACGVVR